MTFDFRESHLFRFLEGIPSFNLVLLTGSFQGRDGHLSTPRNVGCGEDYVGKGTT